MYNKDIVMFGDFFGHKKNVSHVLAVDIGTASISAVLAAAYLKENKREILRIFRYQVNLVAYSNTKESGDRTSHLLKEKLLKAFAEASAALREISFGHIDLLLVSFSDPFFLDEKIEKKVFRANLQAPINQTEINYILKSLEEDAKHSHGSLAAASSEALAYLVNGYEVTSPIGYKAKSLEVFAALTLITPILKEYIESAKNKFFPECSVKYFSDARVLWNALRLTDNLSEPLLFLDIGGEVTGVFLASSAGIEHIGAATFGIRTLERRISASFGMDHLDAEAMLKMYTAGTLDDPKKDKIEKIISSALTDWWSEIHKALLRLGIKGLPKKAMVSGGGADFSVFPVFIKENMKETDIIILKSEAFKDFFYPSSSNQGSLLGGGDVILSALLLFAI